MADWEELKTSLILGKAPEVKRMVQEAVDQECDCFDILNLALIPGITVVGEKMAAGEYFLPEVLLAARAMYSGLDILKPLITAAKVKPKATAVLGTVKGDVHDIGKNLVAMMLEGAGFRVLNLGVNVAPETFVATVREHQAEILGMSAMLTTTMLYMQSTIEALKAAGLREGVKVMIGGAPINQAWAEEIGADAYCMDAVAAVKRAKELLKIEG
jgi:5-methyltetrahydrofolate--homocysteine methyltransferase